MERSEAREAEKARDAATAKFLAAAFWLAFAIERSIPERSTTSSTTPPHPVMPWLKEVLADISSVRITSSAQLAVLYERANGLLHNELKSYIEVYLIPAAILGRKTIVEAESAIWNGEIYAASGREEAYESAVNNLGYFCNRVLMVLHGMEEIGALSLDETEPRSERGGAMNPVVERAVNEYIRRTQRGG